MQRNCSNWHPSVTNMKAFQKCVHGQLNWMMHFSKNMYSIIWKDNYFILLICMHAPSIEGIDSMKCLVPGCNGIERERKQIQTSLVLIVYTIKMQGVDVANQLCGKYSWLLRKQKWWHHVFLLL